MFQDRQISTKFLPIEMFDPGSEPCSWTFGVNCRTTMLPKAPVRSSLKFQKCMKTIKLYLNNWQVINFCSSRLLSGYCHLTDKKVCEFNIGCDPVLFVYFTLFDGTFAIVSRGMTFTSVSSIFCATNNFWRRTRKVKILWFSIFLSRTRII